MSERDGHILYSNCNSNKKLPPPPPPPSPPYLIKGVFLFGLLDDKPVIMLRLSRSLICIPRSRTATTSLISPATKTELQLLLARLEQAIVIE